MHLIPIYSVKFEKEHIEWIVFDESNQNSWPKMNE